MVHQACDENFAVERLVPCTYRLGTKFAMRERRWEVGGVPGP